MSKSVISSTFVCTVVMLMCGVCSAGPLDDLVNDFQRISNQRTPYGVTDGNPSAATAFLASDAFHHFGLSSDQTTAQDGLSARTPLMSGSTPVRFTRMNSLSTPTARIDSMRSPR